MEHPLKIYRKLHNLTLAEMGALVGVRKATVSKWERGVPPGPSKAFAIERVTAGEVSKGILRPDLWPKEAAE